jgi:erythromycin esterase-like protein
MLLLAALLSVCLPHDGPQPEQLAWVTSHAIPLTTVEAGHGFEDLQPLSELIGEARIVALGECTHGSREVFQMKHRLVEFLAREMGFEIFSIEASTPESYRVNDFVSGGEGSPQKLIKGMYFWTWCTAEVLDMVRWMREFNAADDGHIDFTGFDMQTPDVAQGIVVDYLKGIDPGFAQQAQVSYATPAGPRGSDFGVATATFPVAACKGKRIKYQGWIKTRGVDGYAGLWWRADGRSEPVAFDNMSDRGPRDDSDWKQYTIELAIPEETTNINFGVLMPGEGTAWFDGLTVEVDGKPYRDLGSLDLDFESNKIAGFYTPAVGYDVTLDRDGARVGKQALRIAKRPRIPGGPMEADPEQRQRRVEEIRDLLVANRAKFIAASSERDYEWALHNAEIVVQCARMTADDRAGFAIRDECMAQNVKWILDHNPKARIVLWAHNGHVSREEGRMGAHLARMYGKDYVALGFATCQGEYTAVAEGQGLVRDNLLALPPAGSVEQVLHAAGLPIAIFDVRSAAADSPASAFLASEADFRSIGALAQKVQFFPTNVQAQYDGIIWIDRTTASRAMR